MEESYDHGLYIKTGIIKLLECKQCNKIVDKYIGKYFLIWSISKNKETFDCTKLEVIILPNHNAVPYHTWNKLWSRGKIAKDS